MLSTLSFPRSFIPEKNRRIGTAMNPTEQSSSPSALAGLDCARGEYAISSNRLRGRFHVGRILTKFLHSLVSTEKPTTNKRRRGNNRPPQSQGPTGQLTAMAGSRSTLRFVMVACNVSWPHKAQANRNDSCGWGRGTSKGVTTTTSLFPFQPNHYSEGN